MSAGKCCCLAVAIVALVATAAGGQTLSERRKACSTNSKSAPDDVIDNCTALIESGTESDSSVAIELGARCSAYRTKGQYDQALVDCSRAIELRTIRAVTYSAATSMRVHANTTRRLRISTRPSVSGRSQPCRSSIGA